MAARLRQVIDSTGSKISRTTKYYKSYSIHDKYGNSHTNMVKWAVEFEWDLAKEHANIKKHGPTFSEALEAFQDPKGVQLVDKKHSDQEHRFYWVGKVTSGKILTVWFTRRANKVRIIGCAEWRKFRSLYYEAAKTK